MLLKWSPWWNITSWGVITSEVRKNYVEWSDISGVLSRRLTFGADELLFDSQAVLFTIFSTAAFDSLLAGFRITFVSALKSRMRQRYIEFEWIDNTQQVFFLINTYLFQVHMLPPDLILYLRVRTKGKIWKKMFFQFFTTVRVHRRQNIVF